MEYVAVTQKLRCLRDEGRENGSRDFCYRREGIRGNDRGVCGGGGGGGGGGV